MFRNIQTQKRSHESPMDWEWQTAGPTDPSSPFPQFKPQQGHKASFESPQHQSSFVAASSQPGAQFRNPSFTTPRKPFDQELFSETSGIDSSPGDTADAEDTPDPVKSTQAMAAFKGGDTVRAPIFGKYGAGFLGTSPSNAERRRGKYGNAIVSKMRKRKRIDRDYALIRGQRSGSSSESEDDSQPRSREKKKEKTEKGPGFFASIFNYIESHPNLPNVLSFYAQLAVNTFIAALTVFGIYTFWTTVRADVDKASNHEREIVIAEIAKCARDYVENRCGSDVRLPALEKICDNWELCMNRDPNAIGRARVSAHTFAQIFNSFIEPISYKAMIFIVATLILTIFANNMAFGMFRSKHQPHTYPQPPSQSQFFPATPHHQNSFQWGPPPQTPQHTVGWSGYDEQGNSYQAIMPSQTPGMGQRSPSKGNARDRERALSRSPSKGNRERERY